MGDRTREAVRLELIPEDASICPSAVNYSLITVSAQAMLTAMLDGERDPRLLADLTKSKIPQLTGAGALRSPRLPVG